MFAKWQLAVLVELNRTIMVVFPFPGIQGWETTAGCVQLHFAHSNTHCSSHRGDFPFLATAVTHTEQSLALLSNHS